MAAPQVGPDPRLAVWRAAVGRVVPDLSTQVTAATMVLGAAAPSSERLDGLESGAYTLMVACAGDPVRRMSVATTAARIFTRPSHPTYRRLSTPVCNIPANAIH